MGLLKNLLNMGAAYAQHVTAVRGALKLTPEQAVASLTSYVRSLSDASFVGFKLSVASLANNETDGNVKQDLKWIVENADALLAGQFETAPALAAPEPDAAPERSSAHTPDDTARLIQSWATLSEQQCRTQLHATLAQMGEGERRQFIDNLLAGVNNGREELRNLKANESNSWGNSYEDRAAYGMAALRESLNNPSRARQFGEQERALQFLERLASDAVNWQPPRREQQQRSPEPQPPARAASVSADADALEAYNDLMRRMSEKFAANELDDEFFAMLEESMMSAIVLGLAPPEREFAFREWIAEFRSVVDGKKSGLYSSAQSVAEIQRILARRQELLSTAGHHLVDSSARAAKLLPHLQVIKTFTNGSSVAWVGNNTKKANADLWMRISRAVTHLTKLKDDAEVVAFEHTELRSLALAAHEVAMMPHLTLARPLWDCPLKTVAPNRVFFSGADDARHLLAKVCKQKRLDLDAKVSARSYGQSRWDSLRGSAIAVFDWRQYERDLALSDPAAALELAAVAYEYGLSIALGKQTVVLARDRQSLPFDIDTEPLMLEGDDEEDEDAFGAALDTALYARQRPSDDSCLKATFDWLDASLEGHPMRTAFEDSDLLDPELVEDPTAFHAATSAIINKWGGHGPVALFPAWRAAYPASGGGAGKQLFHVMPFSQKWSKAVMKTAEDACRDARVVYQRGDSSADSRILSRVWDGICTADFVLTDISGLNPNVLMELGMAHALGRNTLVVEHSKKYVGKVRNLEKIEVDSYDSNDRLRALVGEWLS